MQTIEKFYGEDLPNKMSFAAEVEMWKEKCIEHLPNDQLEKMTLVDALKVAVPNVHEVLKLILTLPVGSVPCERSFSSMRRLKDWSRSIMNEDRLTGLALLYIHQDKDIDKVNILKKFDSTGHHRIKL